MGTFHARCTIGNPVERSRAAILPSVLVETGSEFTWAPSRTLESIGIARGR